MDIGKYLEMLVKAYNPNQYGKLVERPAKEFLVFIIVTLLLSLVIFTAIIVPRTLFYIQSIPERTASVEQLQLSANVTADEIVLLMDQPRVTLNLDANQTRSGDFTLTTEGILYPKYMFFGTAMLPWSDITDLKQQTPARDRLLASVIIFMLPSIVFWLFTFGTLLCVSIFLLLVLLGWLAPRMFKHRLSFGESCKMGIVAMPSLLIFSLALYPLGAAAVMWAGLILTVILFAVGIAVLSEMDVEEHVKHRRE